MKKIRVGHAEVTVALFPRALRPKAFRLVSPQGFCPPVYVSYTLGVNVWRLALALRYDR